MFLKTSCCFRQLLRECSSKEKRTTNFLYKCSAFPYHKSTHVHHRIASNTLVCMKNEMGGTTAAGSCSKECGCRVPLYLGIAAPRSTRPVRSPTWAPSGGPWHSVGLESWHRESSQLPTPSRPPNCEASSSFSR